MSHQLQPPKQQEGPLGLAGRSEAGQGPHIHVPLPFSSPYHPPSPSALSSCLLSCSFQRLAEPARGSPGLSVLLTLFQMARIKVSMSDEKRGPKALSIGWRGEVGVGVCACM